MAANPTPNPEPPAEPTPEETEAAFWSKHKESTLGILDEWFEKKKEELRSTGTSRGSGRATLPGIIADIMFGKASEK